MATPHNDPDQRQGRTSSTRFFLVFIVALVCAVAILGVLWAIA